MKCSQHSAKTRHPRPRHQNWRSKPKRFSSSFLTTNLLHFHDSMLMKHLQAIIVLCNNQLLVGRSCGMTSAGAMVEWSLLVRIGWFQACLSALRLRGMLLSVREKSLILRECFQNINICILHWFEYLLKTSWESKASQPTFYSPLGTFSTWCIFCVGIQRHKTHKSAPWTRVCSCDPVAASNKTMGAQTWA